MRLFQEMARYEDLFQIMLGVMKLSHTVMLNPGAPVPKDVFFHAGLAMAKLRSRLAKSDAGVDDGAILTMIHLAMFERGLGQEIAFQSHIDQVNKIIASRGGIESLGVDSFAQATIKL